MCVYVCLPFCEIGLFNRISFVAKICSRRVIFLTFSAFLQNYTNYVSQRNDHFDDVEEYFNRKFVVYELKIFLTITIIIIIPFIRKYYKKLLLDEIPTRAFHSSFHQISMYRIAIIGNEET